MKAKILKCYVKGKKTYGECEDGTQVELGAEIRVIAFGDVIGDEAQNFAVVKFRDYDDVVRYRYIARRELITPEGTCKALVEGKYALPAPHLRRALAEYLNAARPTRRHLMTSVTGWYKDKFVLPGKILGQAKNDNPKIVYRRPESAVEAKFGTKGKLADWKDLVASPAANSPVMVLGISAALAAPLVGLCNLEGGGWHEVGPSSKGKTITLLVARSVSGEATREDLRTWRTTSNAVEALAFSYNHSLVCVDDTDQLAGPAANRATMMRDTAHQLANGAGKQRMASSAKGIVAAPSLAWKTLLLSSGMEKLADIVREGGMERASSEQVRLCDLPAVVRDTTGVFMNLPDGCATLEAALRQIEEGCRENYGTALRRFITCLLKNLPKVKAEVLQLMVEFQNLAAINGEDSWEVRFAKKFAVAYAAGILGIRFKVLPWTTELVVKRLLWCYRSARFAIPNADQIATEALEKVKAIAIKRKQVIDLRLLSRKERAALRPAADQAFLDRHEVHGSHLVVRPDVLRGWLDSDRELQLLIQKLEQDGRLIRTESRVPTNQRMYPWEHKRRRYYFISSGPRKKAGGRNGKDA